VFSTAVASSLSRAKRCSGCFVSILLLPRSLQLAVLACSFWLQSAHEAFALPSVLHLHHVDHISELS
jgi:hypothetical protein